MFTFTLAISCLTTSNLPWFMDPTFQVSMQYCSLQHRTLLPSPVTSTIGCCFCFSSVSSFFLELFLHWFPVAYWAPTDLGSSSFSVLFFCLFMLFMGFSRQEYWSGLPFSSPVDHILLDLSTLTCLGWTLDRAMPCRDIYLAVELLDNVLFYENFEELLILTVANHFVSFFWPHCEACRILVSQAGIKPRPSAVEVWDPNHCTSREVPLIDFDLHFHNGYWCYHFRYHFYIFFWTMSISHSKSCDRF